MDFLKINTMNTIKSARLLFLILSLTACSSQKEIKKLPFQTQEVYFQKWIGGQELSGSGTVFYIRFKEPFSPNYLLKRVYFQNKVANFKKTDSITFVAQFYQKAIKSPNNTKENDPQEPTEPKFNLVLDQAIIEFVQDNKKEYFKIEKIKEKELIAYPSMGRPKK